MARTRAYEYPWLYQAVARPNGGRMIEIGGAERGLGSLLREEGHEITTIEIRQKARATATGLTKTQESVILDAAACRALPSSNFDAAYAPSSLEALRSEDLASLLTEITRCLKPKGIFAVTLSLFLNLRPFTGRDSNPYGTNLDVQKLVNQSGLELVSGRPHELYGFREFSAVAILENLERYLIGTYPVLKQCIILRKSDK